LHKLTSNSKKIVTITLLAITISIGLNYSQSTAETPRVYNKEITIIPDPVEANLYSFIGNACVDSKGKILDPKVMLYSDMEQKPLWLTHVFGSDKCFGAVEKIHAKDPDSIVAKVVTYGDYTLIQDMERKIEDLKILQTLQQKELKEITSEKFPKDLNKHIDATREKSDALWKTQKELQKETAKYYEILRYLHPSVEP